jgi:hypothetical protein
LPLNLKAIVDLTLGAITRGREAEREITQITGEATRRGVSTGLVRGTAEVKKKLEGTYTELMKTGMGKSVRVLHEGVLKSSRIQRKTAQNIKSLQAQIDSSTDKAAKKRMLAEKRELSRKLSAEEKAQEKLISRAEKAAETQMELMARAREKMDRTTQQKVKEGAESFRSIMEGALSADNLDAKGVAEAITKGMSGALESGAGSLMARGAGASSGGAAAISALASSAAVLASAAAGIVAVVALFGAAYGQAKDMNKAISEGASAMDLQAASSGGLSATMKDLREAAISTSYDFRVGREEVIQAVGAFNEAGITLKEFKGIVGGTTTELGAYRQVAAMAIVATQGLGIGFSDVADFTNTLTRDLGAGLTDVEGAFGMIASQADKAGMSTKDFFSAINGATSGMALYNFRIGDTVGLFTELVEILGEDLAKEKLGLEGQFRGMGTTERIKSRMLMGGGRADRITRADAQSQGKDFADQFGLKMSKDPKLAKLLGGNGGMDLKALSKLSGQEYRDVYSRMKNIDPAGARRLDDMQKLSKGGTTAMGSTSKAGELALQLAQGRSMSGGKALRDMSGIQRAMMEEVVGLSGEAFDQLAKMETGLLAKYEQSGGAGAFGGKDFYEALASGDLISTEDLEKQGKDEFLTMEQVARESLKETRSISQTIGNVIAGLLEKIYQSLDFALGMFAKDDASAKRLEAKRSSLRSEETALAAAAELAGEISANKAKLQGTIDPGDRKSLIAQISAQEGSKASWEKSSESERAYQRALSEGQGVGDAFASARGDITGKIPLETLKKMGLTRKVARSSGGSGDMIGGRGVSGPTEFDEVADLTNLTEEQRQSLEEQIRLMETEQAQEKALSEVSDQIAEEGFQDVVQAIKDEEKRKALSQLGAEYGYDAASRALEGDWGGVLSGVQKDSVVTAKERQLLERAGLDTNRIPALTEGVNDFIYRGNGGAGSITPINKMDEFFGAKPGGPIHQAGGGKNVNIYINGGDTEKIRSVVTKVLRDTGYSNLKSY